MKKIFTYMCLCLMAIITMLVVSCEKEKLSDVIANEDGAKVSLSLENKIEIADGDNFTLDNDVLTVPVTIKLSGASGISFNVQLAANIDTIATLVGNGTLPAGVMPFQEETFNFPPVVDVPYGVNSATFNLLVSRSFLERNHSKVIALALKISSPSKGNSISAGTGSVVIVVDAAKAIAAEAVHYISFKAAGAPYLVPTGTNYTIGSLDMSIPIDLALSGEAGPDFTVDVANTPEVANALINSGTLKDVILLNSDNFAITNGKVKFAANSSSAKLELTARISELLKVKGKRAAIGLTIRNPSKFQLDDNKKTLVVVLDPDHFRPYNGTPFVIKGAIGEASDMIVAAQYDLGGEGVAYHDNGGKDGDQNYRSPDQVDVSGDYNPRTVVGWTDRDEWLTFSVLVEEDGEYELNTLLGCPNNDGRYSIFFGDENITGILEGKQTPGSYGDQRPHLSTVKLKKGRHIMKFYENVGAYDVRGFIFTRKK